MKSKRVFSLLLAVILLLSMLPLGALAADNADIYLSTTGNDENAGTVGAPVFSLNKAMELVANGGTVHIADSYTAPADFVWDNHEKDVTITGGELDLSQAGETVHVDNEDKLFVYPLTCRMNCFFINLL